LEKSNSLGRGRAVMKNLLKNLWDYLKRVPPAVWGGVAVGLAFLVLILRGRRLEAELAQAKLREQVAKAKVITAKNLAEKTIHTKRADVAAAEAKELEAVAEEVRANGLEEKARIKNLPTHEVHKEYIKLAERAKEKAREQ